MDDIERLRKALEPFARRRLSHEPEPASHDMIISPARMLRLEADAIERRDDEIREARAALRATEGH